MKKNILFFIAFAFLSCSNKNVLQNIVTYKVVNISKTLGEPYDNKLKDNKPLPKSLTDVLVYDIWLTMTKTLELEGISYSNVKKEDILKGLAVYKDKDWKNVIGLRPFTHTSFIKSLSSEDIEILAENIETHIKTNGVWEKPIQDELKTNEVQINVSDTLSSK
jgi:hypothetical protein